MKAFLYKDWGKLAVQEVPEPEPGEGEALIRVEACGICGSELETFQKHSPRRTPPLILGHEFCGRVARLGPGVTGLQEDDPVVVNSVVHCGECFPCSRGDTHLCAKRELFGMHRPGACAEYVVAPAYVVYPSPSGQRPVEGALTEPTANAIHVMHLLPHLRKKTVLVIGAGTIGLLVLQAAKAISGTRVAVSDIKPVRLQVAQEHGADLAVLSSSTDPVAAAREFSGADGVDYVVDAVGAATTKQQSLAACRPGGGVCWIGLHENQLRLNTYDLTLPERAVTGSYSARESEFRDASRLLAIGKISGGRWVKTFALEDAVSAFERMMRADGDDVKAVITI